MQQPTKYLFQPQSGNIPHQGKKQTEQNSNASFADQQIFDRSNELSLDKCWPIFQPDNIWPTYDCQNSLVQPPHVVYTFEDEMMQRNNSLLDDGNPLPATFDAKAVPNMSHRDKVNCWIDMVPFSTVGDNKNNTGLMSDDYTLDYEEMEFDLNKLTTGKHGVQFSFPTKDDLLEFQSRRIDCLVRKIYSLENEDGIEDSD